jgi:hypothetical protein
MCATAKGLKAGIVLSCVLCIERMAALEIAMKPTTFSVMLVALTASFVSVPAMAASTAGTGAAIGKGTAEGRGLAVGRGTVSGTGTVIYRGKGGEWRHKSGTGMVDGRGIAIGRGTFTGRGAVGGRGMVRGVGKSRRLR